MNLRPWVIAKKELLQLRRDRPTLAMVLILPVIQLLLFGYAIDTDVRHISTIVYDQDQSAASRDLAQRLRTTGFYDLVGQARNYAEIESALRAGKARVALVVPARFSSDIARGRRTQIQLIVDGSDPLTVASATNTAASVVAARSSDLMVARLGASRDGSTTRFEPISFEPSTWYNPDLRTAVYVVPGLVGIILTLTMVMLTAMAIARERERGTLEQLIVSPVKKLELVVGKIAPYIAIGYFQMTVVLAAAHTVFDVPIAGSLPLLYALASVFIAANLALGLFFSTLAKTQQQAMQMSFTFLLPNILLSGFVFPFEAMPRPAQWLSQALPLTHFLRIVRGITLRGTGFADVSSEVIALAIILVVLVTLTSLRLTKKLA